MPESNIVQPEYSNLKFNSPGEYYKHVMHFEVPKDPDSMPYDLVLPLDGVGNFFDGIFYMDSHDRGIPRERSQYVGVIDRFGHPRNTEVFVGGDKLTKALTPHDTIATKDALYRMSTWLYPITKDMPEFFNWWHIHKSRTESIFPDTGEAGHEHGPFYSNGDIVQVVSKTIKSLVTTVGAPEGIKVLFKTKMAIKKRSYQVSPISDAGELQDRVYHYYSNRHPQPDEAALSIFLRDEGYVMYGWEPSSPGDSVKTAFLKHEFDNGIKLHRVDDPLWMRNLRLHK